MSGHGKANMARRGSIQQTPPSTPQQSTKTKRPYWAGTEEEYQPSSTPYTPSTEKKIPRKPVPTTGIPSPGFVYKPVEGNPYLPSPTSTKAPSSTHNPIKHKPVEGNPYPDCPSSSKSPKETRNSVKHTPQKSHNVEEKPLPPRPLSPGSIFNNGKPQHVSWAPETGNKRKYSGSLSKGFDSIIRAASTAKHAMSSTKVPDEAPGPKISSPIPGSFRRSGMTPNDDPEPLNLVGLEVAQANVRKYGQADHTLATTQALAVASRASALAKDVRKAKKESPASPRTPETPTSPTHKIPRKPVPKPQPKSTAPAPAPNPRRVISTASDAVTTWGQIIDAGMDETWVKDAEAKQQVRRSKQHAGASTGTPRTDPVPDSQKSSTRMSPAPLRFSKRPSVNQEAPSVPAPEQPYKSAVVQAVRCSNCGGKVAVAAVEKHTCERYPPPRQSREALYAANFPSDAPEDENEVIVDTFVRSQHTSWVGQGKSKDGKTSWSHQDRVGSGSEGRRTLEGSDAEEGSSSLKKILGIN